MVTSSVSPKVYKTGKINRIAKSLVSKTSEIARKTHSRWGGGNKERTIQKLKLFLQSRDKEIMPSTEKSLNDKEDEKAKSRLEPSRPQKYRELEIDLSKKKIAQLFKEFEGNKEQHWQRLFQDLDLIEILKNNNYYNNYNDHNIIGNISYKPELITYFLGQLIEKAKEIKNENNKELPLHFQKIVEQINLFLNTKDINRHNLNEDLISKVTELIHIIKAKYGNSLQISKKEETIAPEGRKEEEKKEQEIIVEPKVISPKEIADKPSLVTAPEVNPVLAILESPPSTISSTTGSSKEREIRELLVSLIPIIPELASEKKNKEKTKIVTLEGLQYRFSSKFNNKSYWSENRNFKTIQKLQLALQNRNYQITVLGKAVGKKQKLLPEEPKKYALFAIEGEPYNYFQNNIIAKIFQDFNADKIKHWQRLSCGIESIAKTMQSSSCKPELAEFFIKVLIEEVGKLPIIVNSNDSDSRNNETNNENIKALRIIKEKLAPIVLISLTNPGQALISEAINELNEGIEEKIAKILQQPLAVEDSLKPLEEAKKPKALRHFSASHNYWQKDIANKTIQKLQLVLQNRNYQASADKKDENLGLLFPSQPKLYRKLPSGGIYKDAREQGIKLILDNFQPNKAEHWECLKDGIQEITSTIKDVECKPEIAAFFIEELTKKVKQFKTAYTGWRKKHIIREQSKISKITQEIGGHLAKLEENLKAVESPQQEKFKKLTEPLSKLRENIAAKAEEVGGTINKQAEKNNKVRQEHTKIRTTGYTVGAGGLLGVSISTIFMPHMASLFAGIALAGAILTAYSAVNMRRFKPLSKLVAPIVVTAVAARAKPIEKQSQK